MKHLECQSRECVCETESINSLYVDLFFLSSVCLRLCIYCVCFQSAFPCCRVSPVDQVTLGANCLSLGALGWAALIVLWPGTRCSY